MTASTPGRDLVVVIPVFNEEGTIAKVIETWNGELAKLNVAYEIHVYDDGSNDQTRAIVESVCAHLPSVKGHTGCNAGHGPTIRRAYVEHCRGFEWVFQVDSDDEMGPDWFYKLWHIRHHHDFMVGKRYERDSSMSRKLVSLFARLTVRAVYGPSIYDVNCPYRLMRSAAFAPCFESIAPDSFAPNILISGFAAYRHLKTVEIHIPHRSRYSGQVSINAWRLVTGSLRSFRQTVGYKARLASLGTNSEVC